MQKCNGNANGWLRKWETIKTIIIQCDTVARYEEVYTMLMLRQQKILCIFMYASEIESPRQNKNSIYTIVHLSLFVGTLNFLGTLYPF